MTLLQLPAVAIESLRIAEHRLSRRLGYPHRRIPDGSPRTLIAQARRLFEQAVQPWCRAVDAAISRGCTADVALGQSTILHSPLLARRIALAGSGRAVVAGLTLGEALERAIKQCWAGDQCDLAYFLDAYASAAVGAFLAALRERIDAWAGQRDLRTLPQYCPGYEGWRLEEQFKLYGLLDAQRARAGQLPIRLLDSGMLAPSKSILGVFLLTSDSAVLKQSAAWDPCATCTIHDCACTKVLSA